ncbi:MAG: hypothetical protein ACLQEQ_01910 [Nitrososphaerales archaeon]
MTTRIAKTATIGAVAVALAVALLAYSAMAVPASAQTATSSSTSTSQTATQTSASSNQSAICGGQHLGNGEAFQWSGAPPGQAFQRGDWFGQQQQSQVSLTVGQTITVTSTSGEYVTTSGSSTNGTASGTLTFTVTGKLSQGYTLSLTSGSLTIAGTTYTISSGSAQMDPYGMTISGQGTTNPTGQFIVHAMAHGTFVGSSASVSLDFTNGTTEYLVTLNGSV